MGSVDVGWRCLGSGRLGNGCNQDEAEMLLPLGSGPLLNASDLVFSITLHLFTEVRFGVVSAPQGAISVPR